ncbi:MAG: T9SS type A sorting domain-containing protein [Bacteroidota bacterium]
MKKNCLLLLITCLFFIKQGYSQADCSSALVICGNTQSFNPSGVGSKLEQLACGGIEHNSIWVSFQAKASGKLNFVIRPFTLAGLPTAADFDWSLWQLPGAPGAANCDAKTQLSCNFSGTATVFGIPGATGMATPNYTSTAFNPGIDVVNGNWYSIIIDQFSNTVPLLFSVQFTGNTESDYLNSTPGIFNNRPDFTVGTTQACAGTFTFTNSSVASAGIASYLWNFGDGSTSTATNPVHNYVGTGTYYVTLTMTDNNGCKTDIRKQVIYSNSNPTITSTGILSLPACSNSNNGIITITTTGVSNPGVTGGTAPYTFELVSPSPSIRASQASNIFTGLQPGGYTVKVTDACGKSATGTTTVTQLITNSTVGLGIQNIQSACSGLATGTATIFANGTVPPYSMQLVASSPVTTGVLPSIQRDPVTATYFTTFTGLLPGVYTVEAIDGCGKVRRATFTVTASTAPTVGLINNGSCAGTATGTITVTATAATGLTSSGSPGAFQYALIAPSPVSRPFQASSVFENLFPGIYTVAVRDACGNIGTGTTTIATAVAPVFGTPFTTSSCPNGSTGTIEAQISAVGGGSPYAFELVQPSTVTRPAQSDNTFSGLPPGSYTVRLTDACANTVTGIANVAAATAPTFTTAVTSSCTTPAGGTITVAPAATAIGPFSFELISPGAAIRAQQVSNVANTSNSIFTDLNQGEYTIRMTDACGTAVTGPATIIAPTALAFPAGSTSVPSCAASSTGQITVAVPATSLANYKYELIAPSPVTRPPQYSRVFNSLPDGDYTIRITDSCGTQVTIGAPLTVGISTAPTLSVTNTSSCATNTGTITCLATTANQGGGTYQYALIAPSAVTRPNQASPIFTGLTPGSYTVQITDQCGATGTANTTILIAGAFTPSAGGSVVACNGAGYFAQIIVTVPQNYTTGGPIPPGSGGGPYTFAVYDAANTTLLAGPQASNIFSNLAPAPGSPSHTIRVTDICGNTSTTTLSVNAPIPLANATITALAASCAASATGVIRVTTQASGGLAPYRYTLIDATTLAVVAGPQTAITFNLVPANATGYLIRSTDACGNVITSAAPLLFPAAILPTATVGITPSCAGSSTGRIVVTPGTGATLAGGTFTYALYNAANTVQVRALQGSPLFTALAAGDYTVRIVDRCGATGTVAASITSTVAALTAAGIASGTCTNGNTGAITGSSTGGSLPISYTLVNQANNAVVAGPQAGNIFSGLAAGTYIIRVTDACGTITNSSDIVLENLLTIPTISTTLALDCAGSATIGAYGGSGNGGPYTYAICTGAGCVSFGPFTNNSNFIVNASGTYRIAVRDRCGNQTASTDIVVTIPTKAVVTGILKANACGPTTITVNYTNVPNTPYYSVDGGNFASAIGVLAIGNHTIRVSNYNAGTFGCASDIFNFAVTDYTIANHLDQKTTTVSAGITNFLATADACRLIATLETTNAVGQVAGNVSGRVWIEAVQPTFNGSPYVKRHYEITPVTNPTTTSAIVTLYFTQQEFTDFNAYPGNTSLLPTGPADNAGKARLRVYKYGGTSSNGTGLPGTYTAPGIPIDPADANIVWDVVNLRWKVSFTAPSFSGFIISNDVSFSLPIGAVQLNASLQNGTNALLEWKIAQAEEGNKFELQRSSDGRVFAGIHVQTGNTVATGFAYNDLALVKGTYYYRVKITDRQGVVTYSNIALIKVGGNNAPITIYPNPVHKAETLTLQISLGNNLLRDYTVTDAQGRIIMQKNGLNMNGSMGITLPSHIVPGVYFLRMKTDDGTATQKVVVK